jgi:hypothetical protein
MVATSQLVCQASVQQVVRLQLVSDLQW